MRWRDGNNDGLVDDDEVVGFVAGRSGVLEVLSSHPSSLIVFGLGVTF